MTTSGQNPEISHPILYGILMGLTVKGIEPEKRAVNPGILTKIMFRELFLITGIAAL
jgi:hypothetical protein